MLLEDLSKDFDGMTRPDKNKSPASKYPRRLMTLHLHPRLQGITKGEEGEADVEPIKLDLPLRVILPT